MRNALRREILDFDVERYEWIAEGYFFNSMRDKALPGGVDLLYKDLTAAFHHSSTTEILSQVLLKHAGVATCREMHERGVRPGQVWKVGKQ